MNKRCYRCKLEKPMEVFCKNPKKADGRTNECVDCARIRTRAYRAANLERVRAHDRARSYEPERAAELYNGVRKFKAENPEKIRAHWAVKDAIKIGKLKRLPCIFCGDPKSHGHHEDYSKPLEVVWLCSAHHKQVHAGKIILTEVVV